MELGRGCGRAWVPDGGGLEGAVRCWLILRMKMKLWRLAEYDLQCGPCCVCLGDVCC